MKYFFLFGIILFFLVSGCSKKNNPVSPQEIKDSNFSSPEEYIQNPSVKNAVQNSGIDINNGNNPPPLAGDYNAVGSVTNASASVKQYLVGANINSLITLYNQTNTGKIDFREKTSGITVWASGGYITGDNGKFTIWQESKQSGAEAGLPNDITIYVALLMSGTKLNNGDLQAEGVAIVTKVETNNQNYDTSQIIGLWWMWQAYFTLEGSASLKINLSHWLSTNLINNNIKKIILQSIYK